LFSPATIEAIESYVYALADAEDRIFYVGKGQGNRVFNHIEEVRRLLIDDPQGLLVRAEDGDGDDGLSPKRQRIAALLRSGFTPSMYIIREGLTPEQALLVEASLISVLDWQFGGALTNQVSGYGTGHFGLKTVSELEATKGEPFRIADLPGLAEAEEVVAININRRWAEVVEKRSTLLDVSKGNWKVNKRRVAGCRYAIIHANGIVRGVFELRGWEGPDSDGRFMFEPLHEDPLPGVAFSQKNASSLFGASGSGSQNPVRYVSVQQQGPLDNASVR
jgi:hypothetical protein